MSELIVYPKKKKIFKTEEFYIRMINIFLKIRKENTFFQWISFSY